MGTITQVRHFAILVLQTGEWFIIADFNNMQDRTKSSFKVISQIAGVKISLTLSPTTLQYETLKTKTKKNPPKLSCLEKQIRKKAFFSVYKMMYSYYH